MPAPSAPRHAVIVARSAPIAPFGELAGDCPVLNRPLRELLVRELAEAGLSVVAEPPTDAPYVLVSDRTWVTAPALRRLLEQAQAPAPIERTVTDTPANPTATPNPAPGADRPAAIPMNPATPATPATPAPAQE